MKYYTIKGLSPVLDGLDVLVDETVYGDGEAEVDTLLSVTAVRNRSILVGDRQLTAQVEPEKLWVHRSCLVECKFPDDIEVASDNPYGKFIGERGGTKEDLTVAMATYEKCTTVSIMRAGSTIYTENFYGEQQQKAVESKMERYFDFEKTFDDLQFDLEELKHG